MDKKMFDKAFANSTLRDGLSLDMHKAQEKNGSECTGVISDVPSGLYDAQVELMLKMVGFCGDEFLRFGSEVWIYENKALADTRKLDSKEYMAAYFKTWSEIEGLLSTASDYKRESVSTADLAQFIDSQRGKLK
ncbi:hypothetical protein ACIOUG_15900 [Pseudomonas sp. NPDC087803]|uniref:hypothetical protein n=1 Tax=Pseudomonas sp. NPDC087803 TaxID=3364448 RepID=UPI003803E8D3